MSPALVRGGMVNRFHLFLGKLLSSFIFEGMFLLFSSSSRASHKYVQLFKSIYEIEFIFWLLFPVAATVGPFWLVQFMVANRNGPSKMWAYYKKVDTTEGYKVQSSYSGDDKPLSIQIKCISWIEWKDKRSLPTLILFNYRFYFLQIISSSFLGSFDFLDSLFSIFHLFFYMCFLMFLSPFFLSIFILCLFANPVRSVQLLAWPVSSAVRPVAFASLPFKSVTESLTARIGKTKLIVLHLPRQVLSFIFVFEFYVCFFCSLFVIRLTCFSRDLIVKSMPNLNLLAIIKQL
jgi:hypothetical protein